MLAEGRSARKVLESQTGESKFQFGRKTQTLWEVSSLRGAALASSCWSLASFPPWCWSDSLFHWQLVNEEPPYRKHLPRVDEILTGEITRGTEAHGSRREENGSDIWFQPQSQPKSNVKNKWSWPWGLKSCRWRVIWSFLKSLFGASFGLWAGSTVCKRKVFFLFFFPVAPSSPTFTWCRKTLFWISSII